MLRCDVIRERLDCLSGAEQVSDAEIVSHLDDCPACECYAEQLRLFDQRVASQLREIAIPEGLQERLLKGLQTADDSTVGTRDTLIKPRRIRQWKNLASLAVGGIAVAIVAVCSLIFFQPADVETVIAYDEARNRLIDEFESMPPADFAELPEFDRRFPLPSTDHELSNWQFDDAYGVNLDTDEQHEAVVCQFSYRSWAGVLIALPTNELGNVPESAVAGSGQRIVEWQSADKTMAYICILHKGRADELLKSVLGDIA